MSRDFKTKLSVLCEDETRPHVGTTDYLIN